MARVGSTAVLQILHLYLARSCWRDWVSSACTCPAPDWTSLPRHWDQAVHAAPQPSWAEAFVPQTAPASPKRVFVAAGPVWSGMLIRSLALTSTLLRPSVVAVRCLAAFRPAVAVAFSTSEKAALGGSSKRAGASAHGGAVSNAPAAAATPKPKDKVKAPIKNASIPFPEVSVIGTDGRKIGT